MGCESPVITSTNNRQWVPWSVADSVDPLDSNLEPTLTAADFIALSKSPKLQEAERVKCELDPWYWRVNYVVTLDEHYSMKGHRRPYHRWPAKRHSQSYVHVLWMYPKTAWPKSRQQMVSWLIITQILGDSIFAGGRLYMIQSKGERDAAGQLSRIWGVFERLRDMAPWLVPQVKRHNDTCIEFDNDSTIIAVPSGGNYVQGYTPYWWFADEAQLQEDAETAYYQALPACERISLVGTPDYGWFCQAFLADNLAQRKE